MLNDFFNYLYAYTSPRSRAHTLHVTTNQQKQRTLSTIQTRESVPPRAHACNMFYRCYLDLHHCSRYYVTCHINITWFRQEFYTLKSVDPTSPAKDISFRRVHGHCNQTRLFCRRGPDPGSLGKNPTRIYQYKQIQPRAVQLVGLGSIRY